VQVRVNDSRSAWHAEDLTMLKRLSAHVGVRCPKVECTEQVRSLAGELPGRPLHLLVESALGLELAYSLATAAPQVASLGLGEADLRSDLGVSDDEGLTWARTRIVAAARAAKLPAPMMSVYPNLQDAAGLVASCRVGRKLGFLGRAAIHPGQLEAIRGAFLPSEEEVDRARRVIEQLRNGGDDGVGVGVLEDGSFVDRAMVQQAETILQIAGTDAGPDPAGGEQEAGR